MKKPVENPSVEISPPVHLEFIQNQASLPDNPGLEEVEQYHRALFLNQHATELARYQEECELCQGRLQPLEARLSAINTRLAGEEKLVPVNVDGVPDVQPAAPWNLWDRLMFGAALASVVCLIVFGVLNISFNLLESGLVTFVQSPVRAYFWAALLPVGALAVKLGWDFLQDQKAKSRYLWSCLALGIAGVLAWVAAYAVVYPTLSKSTEQHIEALSVFDDPQKEGAGTLIDGGARTIDAIIVAAQAVAEIFLSAALGIYMTILYNRHRPVRLAGNPLFTQLDEERRGLESDIARERLALASARGNQTRLENQLAALVAYAKSMFLKEASARRDQSQQKRAYLDQISEQLRNHLQVIESQTYGDRSANGQATLPHTNGK